MERVLLIGCSGAGKSTLAAQIAERTGLPFIPTDPFYWEANWQPASREAVAERLSEAVSQSTWVLDGGFLRYRDLVWQRADTVIWLDLPHWLVVLRVMKRNLGWWITRQPTWSGNRMTWWRAWSGIRFALRSCREKQRSYRACLDAFPHLAVLHFRTSEAAHSWLASLPEDVNDLRRSDR